MDIRHESTPMADGLGDHVPVPARGVTFMSGRFAVNSIKRLDVPAGPWSYRRFFNEQSAIEFWRRLTPNHPKPFRLTEDCVAPDGERLPAGMWIVLYQVFQ
jgi:hypothetical protein